jgi:hypothetical protein
MEIKSTRIWQNAVTASNASLSFGKGVGGGEDFEAIQPAEARKKLLRQIPAVRRETVDRARNAIGQIGWPQAPTIRQIADFLAFNLCPKSGPWGSGSRNIVSHFPYIYVNTSRH